jgi:pyruvate dehydrogenase E2 component (dihydrolipoamide acetyltransferase)
MASDFLMPKLGLTMEEGRITAWLVGDGSEVTAGTAVLAIDTDKVETEVEASASGVLHQLGAVGETFPCGAVIGHIGADRPSVRVARSSAAAPLAPIETVLPRRAPVASPGGNGRRFISPNARRVAAELGVDVARVDGTGPGGRVLAADVEAAAREDAVHVATATGASTVSGATRGAGGVAAGADEPVRVAAAASGKPVSGATRTPATAAARQLADLIGIDLAAVDPDPHDGYVTREAVARHVRARLRATSAPVADGPLGQTPTEVRPLKGMRGTIAKRMHTSLQQMAQLTLTTDAEMDAVVADRRARGEAGGAPGYTDYVVAAAARALRDHPIVNAQVIAEGIALLPEVHVGVAVALPTGLVVPVVRHADRLGLSALAAESTRLADAARAGKLTLATSKAGRSR